MQPISEECYTHRSLAKLHPALLENSEDAEYDERVGSLYSVAQFTEEGDIVLNQFEKRNGGWLLLFLQYMLKVVNSLKILFFIFFASQMIKQCCLNLGVGKF